MMTAFLQAEGIPHDTKTWEGSMQQQLSAAKRLDSETYSGDETQQQHHLIRIGHGH